LNSCIKDDEAEGDDKKKNAIITIIRKEAKRKLWRHVNRSTKKPRGGQVLSVKVKTGETTEKHDTEDGIFGAVSIHLAERFQLAFSAPCMRGKLFDDIGFIGDTTCAQQAIDGTCVFPQIQTPPQSCCWRRQGLLIVECRKSRLQPT
jgi:hypothetical protein